MLKAKHSIESWLSISSGSHAKEAPLRPVSCGTIPKCGLACSFYELKVDSWSWMMRKDIGGHEGGSFTLRWEALSKLELSSVWSNKLLPSGGGGRPPNSHQFNRESNKNWDSSAKREEVSSSGFNPVIRAFHQVAAIHAPCTIGPRWVDRLAKPASSALEIWLRQKRSEQEEPASRRKYWRETQLIVTVKSSPRIEINSHEFSHAWNKN